MPCSPVSDLNIFCEGEVRSHILVWQVICFAIPLIERTKSTQWQRTEGHFKNTFIPTQMHPQNNITCNQNECVTKENIVHIILCTSQLTMTFIVRGSKFKSEAIVI